jgi:hypothetical protein
MSNLVKELFAAAPLGKRVRRLAFVLIGASTVLAGIIVAGNAASPTPVTVLTYHYDNRRTGWNPNETVLTTANVNSSSFGLLRSVPVGGPVDAQPLVIYAPEHNNLPIVIVATQNDNIYYINSATGAVVLSRNLGTPVPQSMLPGQCGNNSTSVGITSTPVIDVPSHTLYVIAYTLESGQPVYRIHALDLATLNDKVASGVVIGASQTLSDGTVYDFTPSTSRQRPALLEANGNIYAGFGSFCDFAKSRGWLLGWQTGTLKPLPANHLNDSLGTSRSGQFLSSIWMSGAGIATDRGGHLFFVTGNSDPQSYEPPENIQESVVEMSADLTQILGLFTPSGSLDDVGQRTLDMHDEDFGSGGVLVVPAQGSLPLPGLAVAAGKAGYLYLFNRDGFAGATSPSKVVQSFHVAGCYCAESYFVGPDGIGRVVGSLGVNVVVYKLQSTGTGVNLVQEVTSAGLKTGQDAGFFTTVSSNGRQAGSAIVWAFGRPTGTTPDYATLYAFAAATGATLYSAPAGTWPQSTANANVVPVVANGQVYVATHDQLAIFGLGGNPAGVTASIVAATAANAVVAPDAAPASRITGTVKAISGSLITLQTRSGLSRVDATAAQRADLSARIYLGEALLVRGTRGAGGLFEAASIMRAKSSPLLWPPDH